MSKVLLVVAAHPDDEVLGCGATVAKLKGTGWRCVLVLMTRGITGRTGSVGTIDGTSLLAQNRLADETRRAAEIIGFDRVICHDFPDNRMDTVPCADLAHVVAATVAEEKPNLVLTHHPGDYNWDHSRTFDAVMMGARPNPPAFCPTEIRTFEVLSSTERAWQEASRAFHPNCWVDVGQTIDRKKEGLACYVSEVRPYPHPRSREAVEYLARTRGNQVGFEYAEAFHVVRRIER
jgi:LmbE family N-acetylglucosaminyl deacetylase